MVLVDFCEDTNKEGWKNSWKIHPLSTLDLLQAFVIFLSEDNGPLSSFWMYHIDMVDRVLLGLVCVSRGGSWQLHLFTIQEVIPWCFPCNKTNYSTHMLY